MCIVTIRWNAVRGLVMFAAVLAVAGCSVNDKERPADVEAASPNASASPSPTVTPTASPSSLSADPAGEKACNEVKTIKVNDLRADVNTLYEAGQAGSESVNGEVKQKS